MIKCNCNVIVPCISLWFIEYRFLHRGPFVLYNSGQNEKYYDKNVIYFLKINFIQTRMIDVYVIISMRDNFLLVLPEARIYDAFRIKTAVN